MNKYYRTFLLAMSVCIGFVCNAQMDLSPTKYDWSNLSSSITRGKTTAHDKFYAIYRWLCDNIAYDTTYSIHTADECYEARRGVCQAYAELFCRLSEAEGLKADIVNGYSKSDKGFSDTGHAWIFAYTDPESGVGMLIDPTWGAGSVDGGVFTRSKQNDFWFNVSPEWLIFTHFPKEEAYQLIDSPISMAQFKSITPHMPFLGKCGFDPKKVLDTELSGRRFEIPMIYESAMERFDIKSMQAHDSPRVRVGQPLAFAFETNAEPEDIIALSDGIGPAFNTGQWERQGKYIVGRVIPAREGHLAIGIKNPQNTYSTIVEYTVERPTDADIRNLEDIDPSLSPLWDRFENFHLKVAKEHYIDLNSVLKAIRGEGLKNLPTLYSGTKYGVQNVPWNGELRVGQTYRFEFLPYEGYNCAIINKDTAGHATWMQDWTQDPTTGAWCMDVTPVTEGVLNVSIQKAEGESYSGCLGYKVVR